MAAPDFDLKKAHRWFAAETNNRAWGLIDNAELSSVERDQALHLAHASCFHWSESGEPIHRQRALVLVAQAHAAAGDGEVAGHFARAALQLGEELTDEMQDWDWAFTHDSLARAAAALGEQQRAGELKAKARAAGEAIADPEDRKVFMASFASGNWHGVD